MKRKFPLVLLCLLLVFVFTHLGNRNTTKITVHSTALQKDMHVNVYLPEGYSSSEKYPVLYLFHGKDGNEDSFMNGFFGINGVHIDKEADQLIAENKINKLIVVAPEIDNSYGVNSSASPFVKDGYDHGLYEDYILKELMPYIENHYLVLTSREGRYAGGISMGGFVAYHLAFAHPELFSKVGGHSAAVWKSQSDMPTQLSWLGKDNDELFSMANTQNISGISVYIDHGDMDHSWLSQGNAALADILTKRHVSVQSYVGRGGHNYSYWSSHAADYLMFYAGK